MVFKLDGPTNISPNHENTKNNVALKNWSVLCDVKFIVGLGLLCILPLFDYMHTLIKIESGRCHDFNLGHVSKIKA
jgi:hypothetical protein